MRPWSFSKDGDSLQKIIDLQDFQLIDEHCHPFSMEAKKLTKEKLLNLVSIGGPYHEGEEKLTVLHSKELILYKVIIKELSNYFKIDGTEVEILEKRNEKAQNFREYVEELFNNIKIKSMIVDDGFSETLVEHPLPKVELDKFKQIVSFKVYHVHRIEPIIMYAYKNSKNFEEFISIIEDDLRKSSKKPGFKGFKTITAYRTGLNITWREEEEAKEEYRRYKNGEGEYSWFGPVLRKTREYVIRKVAEFCAKGRHVFQIHTGIGDKDIIFGKCNPKHLFTFLKKEEIRKTRIVLVHGGYPYSSETAWIVNAFPNVFMDLSILIPFGLTNAATRIKQILELAPVSKIFYATDGYSIPELHWIGGILAKKTLARVLTDMIKDEVVDEDEAYKIAKLILTENAEREYNLK